MSKIKTNNFANAEKEIKAMDAEQIKRIPESIAKNDSKFYHVALVRIIDRPGEVKNDVNVNVQMFHRNGFEKLNKNFRSLGFSKLVLIHDPSQKMETADAPKPAKAEPKASQPAKESKPETKKEFDLEKQFQDAINGNKADLMAFADVHDIDLGDATNNDQRKEVITEWFNGKMEENSND